MVKYSVSLRTGDDGEAARETGCVQGEECAAVEIRNEGRLVGRVVPQTSAIDPELPFAHDAPVAQMKPIVSRTSLLTLWASVVAERLGHERMTALTLAKAVAGTTARLKVRVIGRKQWVGGREETDPDLGMDLPRQHGKAAMAQVVLLGKRIPLLTDASGQPRAALRTLPTRDGGVADEYVAADPAEVDRYLIKTFGLHLADLRTAMEGLAACYEPMELNRIGRQLYENFQSSGPHNHKGRPGKAAQEIENVLATLPHATNHDTKPTGIGADRPLPHYLPRVAKSFSIPESSSETDRVVAENCQAVRRINETVAKLQVTATELESSIAKSRQLIAESLEAMALRNEDPQLAVGIDRNDDGSADFGV
jgi:hypothetical protein